MEPLTIWVIVIAVLLLAAFAALVSVATRADRLHNEVLRTRATLDRHLHGRAAVALEIAHSGRIDPATALILADIAGRAGESAGSLVPDGLDPSPEPEALAAETRDRALVESELTRGLRVILPEFREQRPEDRVLQEELGRLVDHWYRVTIARSLHNSRVVQARRLRGLWYVRLFRLAGRATMPVTFDMDDAVPDSLLPHRNS